MNLTIKLTIELFSTVKKYLKITVDFISLLDTQAIVYKPTLTVA